MNGLAELEPIVAEDVMKFALEPYSERLVQEMRPLWDAHNEEVPQLGLPLDPDLGMYSQCSSGNRLRIFTARIGAGWESTLVGYQTFFVMKHPHRKYSVEAMSDILYLDPELRKGLVGFKFLKWCDEQLERESVKAIHHQVSLQKDLGVLFKRMGYQAMDITYARRI